MEYLSPVSFYLWDLKGWRDLISFKVKKFRAYKWPIDDLLDQFLVALNVMVKRVHVNYDGLLC